jgi:hypothetical protein
MHRGRFSFLAVALVALLAAVALPAVALAQSSGEDQYTDPLAGGGGSSGGGGSGGSSGGGSGGGGGGSAPAQPASSADSTPAPKAAPAQATQNDGLPRTGFPVALLLGSGLIMVGTGLAVRRRTT